MYKPVAFYGWTKLRLDVFICIGHAEYLVGILYSIYNFKKLQNLLLLVINCFLVAYHFVSLDILLLLLGNNREGS